MRSRRHRPVLILSWQCQSAMAARRKSNILDIVSINDGTQGATVTQTVPPGRRGRPRSARVRAAVVRAAAQLTRAGGPAAATVDAIAKRAAVSRTTIYKWWPSSAAIVLEGLLDSVRDPIIAPPGSSSQEALDHHLRALNAILTDTTTGPLLRDVVAAAASDPAMARVVLDQWLHPVARRWPPSCARRSLRVRSALAPTLR